VATATDLPAYHFLLKCSVFDMFTNSFILCVTGKTKWNNNTPNYTRPRVSYQYYTCFSQLGPHAQLRKSGKLCFSVGESRADYFWGSRPGKKPQSCSGSLDHSSAL